VPDITIDSVTTIAGLETSQEPVEDEKGPEDGQDDGPSDVPAIDDGDDEEGKETP